MQHCGLVLGWGIVPCTGTACLPQPWALGTCMAGEPALSTSMSAQSAVELLETRCCIAAIDMDCFYAQAEEVRQPSLKGRPVGVCGAVVGGTSTGTVSQRSLGPPLMTVRTVGRGVPESLVGDRAVQHRPSHTAPCQPLRTPPPGPVWHCVAAFPILPALAFVERRRGPKKTES